MTSTPTIRRRAALGAGTILAIAGLSVLAAGPAQAAVVIYGPIDLGAANTFAVLGSSAITNTGPSVIAGDLGVSPGTSAGDFTGTQPVRGTTHYTDTVAADAQLDLTDAMNDAASLTPIQSGLANLTAMNLTPGVYSGGALAIDAGGLLTLTGGPESVWVFQAASSLVTGAGSQIQILGGGSACNVFWRVTSDTTLNTTSQFVGTVMSGGSISTSSGTTVSGRLLADTGAVTLINTVINSPTGCAPGVAPTTTVAPTITSGTPTAATAGTPYSYTVTASGTPSPGYTVTSGALPTGLTLDSTTGTISGTPTGEGTSTFTITVSNGTAPDATATYTITTAAVPAGTTPAGQLASTGSESTGLALGGLSLLAAGLLLVAFRRSPATARRSPGSPSRGPRN